MIDQTTIERILDAARIVDVVSEFVTLRKRGINYVGLCPFHDDTTPSFYVSPVKGICKCFACGVGGNAVHFIMRHEQISYPEALKYLAGKYHIDIQEKELTNEEKVERNERESLFVVNQFARQYFQDTLLNHPQGQSIGMAYLRGRGFRDDIIAKFQLGYSLEQRDAFSRHALSQGYKEEYLLKTGLSVKVDENRLGDRFYGRVIFPIHTLSGKVVAFGGRVLAEATKGVKVKYINSPESDIYHKGNELYGIYFAKQAIVKQDRCYLVEGYTDVIALHQCGMENVVASSGTALTAGQIKAIHRFTDNITLLYDGDSAGIKASLRGVDMLLSEGMNVKVCLLPEGEDPDSYARTHSSKEFQEFVDTQQTDFIRFKTNLLLSRAGNDPIKKATLIDSIVQSISVIPQAIKRDVYVKECAQLLHTEDKLLVSEVAKRRSAQPTNSPQTGQITVSHTLLTSPDKEDEEFYTYERQILQVIIRFGERVLYSSTDEAGNKRTVTVTEYVVNDLAEDDLTFHNPLHRRILSEAMAHSGEAGFMTERYFLMHPDPEVSRVAIELSNVRYQLSKYHSKFQKVTTDEERLYDLVPTLMINFKYATVNKELQSMLRELQDPELAQNPKKCDLLMARYNRLREIRDMMAKRLGDRIVLH